MEYVDQLRVLETYGKVTVSEDKVFYPLNDNTIKYRAILRRPTSPTITFVGLGVGETPEEAIIKLTHNVAYIIKHCIKKIEKEAP